MFLILVNLILNLPALSKRGGYFWFFKAFTLIEILVECMGIYVYLILTK